MLFISCIVCLVTTAGVLRIGELSRRSGVKPELLRAWERRYGLLRPTRSPGGTRLYSQTDLRRVQAMQRYLAEGLAAAEAAALAAEPAAEAADATFAPAVLRRDLEGALSAFDEPRAHSILDSLLAATTLDSALSEVIVPYLHELGERWERGDASVAQEHFASSVLRGRLLGLARGWGRGLGQTVLLACAPSEQHDLGLIAFGLALRARGWRIGYLGADTPLDSVSSAARAFEPLFVVISAVSADRFQAIEGELGALAREQRVCLGGAAASERLNLDAVMLTGDPVHEAERLTTLATSSADA
jgi:MerR family transcriptional regulator, light-induced transcriptional regulator